MATYKQRTPEEWEALSFKGMVEELNKKFGHTYISVEERNEEDFKDFFNIENYKS